MKLLMHICCANCCLFPVATLRDRGVDVRGYWFNPNIHPEEEYGRRLQALREIENLWELPVEYVDRYGREEFTRALQGREGTRCEGCYEMRLSETARAARRMDADAFTTSLLVSPFQRHERILEAGRRAARRHGVPFVGEDFRPGWTEGSRLSRELGLYRQNYCGCLESKAEREQQRMERKRKMEAIGA
jgi:predicted adenine nucleotide alpha hydrolase (AANH) superfamily ATPase